MFAHIFLSFSATVTWRLVLSPIIWTWLLLNQQKHQWYTFCLQEKKGQPPMDAAQRSEFENGKLNKILSMVREQPEAAK